MVGRSFIGREREVARVVSALSAQGALVSIVGPPGIGKSAIAREVAARWPGRRRRASCDLHGVKAPADVAIRLAQAVGTRPSLLAGAPIESWHEGSVSRDLLLVVDDADDASELAELLAPALALGMRAVVTRRQPLGAPRERVVSVGPLSARDAVALFDARASSPAKRGERAVTAEIVRRLGCFPLAIELAARRTALLTRAEILARTAEALDLLGGDAIGALVEHAWLALSDSARRALARVSVLDGWWSIETAEAVIGPGAGALDALAELRAASLLDRADSDGASRFSLPAPVLSIAREKLASVADRDAASDAHTHHCLALAERVLERSRARERDAAAERALAHDYEQVRAAFRRELDARPEIAARLVTPLDALARTHLKSSYVEMLEALHARLGGELASPAFAPAFVRLLEAWVEAGKLDLAEELLRAMRQPGVEPSSGDDRARASCAAGMLLVHRSRFEDALAEATGAVETARAEASPRVLAIALDVLGTALQCLGRHSEAREAHEASVSTSRAIGDARLTALALRQLAGLEALAGEVELACARAVEARATAHDAGDAVHECGASIVLGFFCHAANRPAEARRALEHGRALAARLHLDRYEAIAVAYRARLELERGRLARARADLDRAYEALARVGDPSYAAGALVCLARVATLEGKLDEARYRLDDAERLEPEWVVRAEIACERAVVEALSSRADGAREKLADARRWYARSREAPELRDTAIALLEALAGVAEAAPRNGGRAPSDIAQALAKARAAVDRAITPAGTRSAPASRSVEVRLNAALLERVIDERLRRAPLFEVARDGSFFARVGDRRVELESRRAARAIVARLVEAYERQPGVGLLWSDLLETAWPGVRTIGQSGFQRVRTEIWTLRKLGLGPALERDESGYLLVPGVTVIVEGARAQSA